MALFLKERKGMNKKPIRIRPNKKGESIPILAIGKLVLAAVAILIISGLLFVALKLILDRPQQGTTESLKNLDEAIKTLLNYKEAECYIPVYVDESYVIVGYDAGDAKPIETCLMDEEIERPKECKSDACICLCGRGWGDLGKDDCLKNQGCKTYESEKLTSITSQDENGAQQSLVLYGLNCVGVRKPLGVKNVMLTKKDKTLNIRRVENTMGAEPCVALKYA
jgi:hypothetical protein